MILLVTKITIILTATTVTSVSTVILRPKEQVRKYYALQTLPNSYLIVFTMYRVPFIKL